MSIIISFAYVNNNFLCKLGSCGFSASAARSPVAIYNEQLTHPLRERERESESERERERERERQRERETYKDTYTD
jgi:hypothetical protein